MVLIIRRTLPEWQFAAMVVAFVLAVVVGASRIYLQVHFPSDVLAGFALGIAWGVQPVLRACYAARGRWKSGSLEADPG
jgi:undecaprenyl-diphosphatase